MKISLLWLSGISCLFTSLCQSLKKRAKAVLFLTRQREELGVSLVEDPDVMSEALGLKLTHWHWGPEVGQSFQNQRVLPRLWLHTCRLQPALGLSAFGTGLGEDLQLSLILSKWIFSTPGRRGIYFLHNLNNQISLTHIHTCICHTNARIGTRLELTQPGRACGWVLFFI